MLDRAVDEQARGFDFDPTDAIMRSRANAAFVRCPGCGADAERYLFHEQGARFVQCRSCHVVYTNPPAREVRNYFDVDTQDSGAATGDREHLRKETEDVLRHAVAIARPRTRHTSRRVLLIGRIVDPADL